MNCTEAEERLGAYVDGELPDADREGVEGHLAACAECRRFLQGCRAQDAELEAAFAPLRTKAEALAGKIVRRLPRRRAPWLPVIVSAAAGFLAAWLSLQREEEPAIVLPPPIKLPMARLVVSTGAVEVRQGGDWAPLATGGGVERGASIRTLGRAKCSFQYNDGTEIRLNHDTEIRLEKPRAIDLAAGRIFTHIKPNPVTFEVRTDQALIEALGTTLDIAHALRNTTLTVLDGRARMGPHTVGAGFRCAVVDGAIEEPEPARDLTILTNWVHEILALKEDRTELNLRINELLAMLGRTKMEHLYEWEIRALGDRCAFPLTCYIQSAESRKDSPRRQKAARILADAAGPTSVPDLVGLLRDADPSIRTEAARGLGRITGHTLGYPGSYWEGATCAPGQEAWSQWLQQNEGARNLK